MTATRQSGGRFAPGLSANPKGRPRGQSKATGLRKELADALPGILQMLVQAASAGDVAAIRLILERVMPTMRPIDATVTVNMTGTLSEQGQAVLSAIATGKVTPSQGGQLIAALGVQARIVEAVDLDERLTRLENIRDET